MVSGRSQPTCKRPRRRLKEGGNPQNPGWRSAKEDDAVVRSSGLGPRRNPRRAGPSTKLRVLGVALVASSLGCLCAAASPALAGISKEFQVFKDCPYENPEVASCIYSTTTSGEFTIGNKTVPVNQTVILQGGLQRHTEELAPAKDGNTLSKT